MTAVWRVRALVVALVIAGAEAVLVVVGMGPRVVLVAAIIMVASAVVFLALDVAESIAPAEWPSTVTTPPTRDGVEWRVGTLRMLLVNERRTEASRNRLQQLLVALIDDHLLAEHGVERATDPAAAAAIIGPELNMFVTSDRPAQLSARDVARVVTLIESLEAEENQ